MSNNVKEFELWSLCFIILICTEMGVTVGFPTIGGISAGRMFEIGKKLPSTTRMINSLLLYNDQKIKAVVLLPFQQKREWLC
jgi:hypothetical protein